MLGKKLKYLRVHKKMTIEQLVKIFNETYNLNLSKGTISRYETSRTEPTASTLSAYVDYFNCSADWLLKDNIIEKEIVREREELTKQEWKEVENYKHYLVSKRKGIL